MKTIHKLILLILIVSIIPACKKTQKQPDNSQQAVNVKVTTISRMDLIKHMEFYGKTVYLNKNRVTAPVTGYIAGVQAVYGKKVSKNDLLFTLETREQKALGTSSTEKRIEVRSNADGYISSLQYNNSGDFVTEGDVLCIITEDSSPNIMVNVPYEDADKIHVGSSCDLLLSDQTKISGIVTRKIPAIEDKNQTQEILIKPDTKKILPENLNLTVRFIDAVHKETITLPKQAIMTNETQNEYWIMKAINGMALKVPVTKGIENDSLVEITKPELSENDKIIFEGAYELPDSSNVNIIQ